MNLNIKLLLATCVMVSFAKVIALDYDDDADTRSKNKKFDCLTVKKHFNSCGDAVIAGLLTANGGVAVNGNQTIVGNLTVDGNLILTTTGTAGDTVIGNQTITGNLTVGGAATVGSIALSPTAAVGTPGVPGIGGDLAYGILSNITSQTVANTGAVQFSTVGAQSGMVGAAGGITVTNAGLYVIRFQVLATPTVNADPVVFELQSNATVIPASIFSSGLPTAGIGGETLVVNGFALVQLPAGAVISVNNLTGVAVFLPTVSAGAGNNAALLIERIA